MKDIGISVIMSAYNESLDILKESIDSILMQSHKKFEFIIVLDNPENFEMKLFLEEYSKKHNEIKCIFNYENKGLANSLNIAIKNSKFDIIARMDADDISKKNRLEIQLRALTENNIDVLGTNRKDINEYSEIISNKKKIPLSNNQIKRGLKYGSVLTHPSVMYRKDKIIEVGGYRDFRTAQDYDLWLRLLYNKAVFGNLDEDLILYRIRSNSITKTDQFRQYLSFMYQKNLYKERKRTGKDSFSLENYNNYLRKNGYFDDDIKKSFNISYDYFLNSIKFAKEYKVFSSIRQLSLSYLNNKDFRKLINNIIKFQLYKLTI